MLLGSEGELNLPNCEATTFSSAPARFGSELMRRLCGVSIFLNRLTRDHNNDATSRTNQAAQETVLVGWVSFFDPPIPQTSPLPENLTLHTPNRPGNTRAGDTGESWSMANLAVGIRVHVLLD